MLALGAQNLYEIRHSSGVWRWLLVTFGLCVKLKKETNLKWTQVNNYPPLNAFIGGFTLGNLNYPFILLQKEAADYIKFKKWPWLWQSCHLNWLCCDQTSLHFRAMQSNTRQSLPSVLSLHVFPLRPSQEISSGSQDCSHWRGMCCHSAEKTTELIIWILYNININWMHLKVAGNL